MGIAATLTLSRQIRLVRCIYVRAVRHLGLMGQDTIRSAYKPSSYDVTVLCFWIVPHVNRLMGGQRIAGCMVNWEY